MTQGQRTTEGLHFGGRVEMLDGSHQGSITEIQGEHCLFITWDDGEAGHVHPADVKHLPDRPAPDDEHYCSKCGQSWAVHDGDGSCVDDAALEQAKPEPAICPACGGPGVELGTLGALKWKRCRDCGIEFHGRVTPVAEPCMSQDDHPYFG